MSAGTKAAIVDLFVQRAAMHPDGREDEFWSNSLYDLAELLNETRHLLTLEQQSDLVQIGTLIAWQIERNTEALVMAENAIGRAGGAI